VLEGWLTSRRALELTGKIGSSALLVSFQPRAYGQGLSTNGARQIAARYYSAVGLPLEMFGLHTLRRTAGTHLYRATRDLHVVADILGHSSVNTSAIYAKMDTDVRLEALEKLEQLQKLD
jgi:integrase/recombinase XerC